MSTRANHANKPVIAKVIIGEVAMIGIVCDAKVDAGKTGVDSIAEA